MLRNSRQHEYESLSNGAENLIFYTTCTCIPNLFSVGACNAFPRNNIGLILASLSSSLSPPYNQKTVHIYFFKILIKILNTNHSTRINSPFKFQTPLLTPIQHSDIKSIILIQNTDLYNQVFNTKFTQNIILY